MTNTNTNYNERRSEGLRRMANKYGVQKTKLFVGLMDAVDSYWVSENAKDKIFVDEMFDMLEKQGLKNEYNEFLDSEEYDMVETPLEFVVPYEYC